MDGNEFVAVAVVVLRRRQHKLVHVQFLAFVLVIVGLFPNLLLGLLENSGSGTSEPSEVQTPSEPALPPDPEPQPQQAMLAN